MKTLTTLLLFITTITTAQIKSGYNNKIDWHPLDFDITIDTSLTNKYITTLTKQDTLKCFLVTFDTITNQVRMIKGYYVSVNVTTTQGFTIGASSTYYEVSYLDRRKKPFSKSLIVLISIPKNW